MTYTTEDQRKEAIRLFQMLYGSSDDTAEREFNVLLLNTQAGFMRMAAEMLKNKRRSRKSKTIRS